MLYSLKCIDLLPTRLYFSIKYFFVFDAIVNEIIFSTSFSDNSLFECRNTTDF